MTTSAAILEAHPAQLPRKFGPYLLFDLVGKGGMAEIYLARAQTNLGGRRLCVVKEILPALAAHEPFAEMLVREAKLAARLDHTNIVKVLDLGRVDGRLYIAMEYVEGLDLSDLLRRCTKEKVPLPVEFALTIVCSVLRGLDYAHRRTSEGGVQLGIVHRDVSPSNVLVSFDGEVKLCDFGIAHANELVDGVSKVGPANGVLQGKAGYMSPEHARGEDLDARADVFSAGILLWELLSGHRMYQDGHGMSLLDQARRAQTSPPVARGLPDEARLHHIVMKALAGGRDARYASAAAMFRDLEAYASDANLLASALKLGTWMESHFGSELVARRRMRQRAAEALEKGPPVVLVPLVPPEPPAHRDSATVAAGSSPLPTPVVGSRPFAFRLAWALCVAIALLAVAWITLRR